jgi:hypothetical protein
VNKGPVAIHISRKRIKAPHEITLAERFLQQFQRSPQSLGVDDPSVEAPQRGSVRKILRAPVTSTSALKRGTPYAVTAWAPNTYQGPQRDRTGASAASSSTAAGCIGTLEQVRQPDVIGQVGLSIFRCRPVRTHDDYLCAKLAGNAQSLRRTQSRDARAPVVILAVASGSPVAFHEFTDPASDHADILVRSLTLTPCPPDGLTA